MKDRRPLRVVALVSLGHLTNHLIVMVVPPLVVTWVEDFAIDYTAIGVIMAVTAITSAVSVVPVGILTDRVPARHVLIAGLCVLSLSVIGLGFSQSYSELLVWAAFMGLGNTVFHPCGYTILSAGVPKQWLGRAFSVHTFAGYAGFALTPAFIGLAVLYWDWRSALIAMGLAGFAVAAAMTLHRDILVDGRGTDAGDRDRDPKGKAILLTLPVQMCFAFFFLTTIAYWGFDSFLPASLFEHHGIPETLGTFALTVFFGFSAVGILIGGVIADRTTRHDLTATGGFVIAAACIFLIGDVAGGTATIFILIAIAGLGAGVVTPSRDLIVRRVTPTSETGKVFAFMTLGMDAGTFIAPPLFGILMDGGHVVWLFRLAAIMLICSVLTVTATQHIHRHRGVPA